MDWVFNKSIALKHFFKYKGFYYSVVVDFAHDCIYTKQSIKRKTKTIVINRLKESVLKEP